MKSLLKLVNTVIDSSKLVTGKIQNGLTFKNGKETPIMEDGKYIEDPTIAKKLLPVKSGFFFGNYDEETAYDQYYFEDLVLTKKILETALKDSAGEYYYNSSW